MHPLEYLVALPSRHRLIGRSNVTLADFVDERMIVGSTHTIGRKLMEQVRFRLGMK